MDTYLVGVPIVLDNFVVIKLTLRKCLDFQGFSKWFKLLSNITIDDVHN